MSISGELRGSTTMQRIHFAETSIRATSRLSTPKVTTLRTLYDAGGKPASMLRTREQWEMPNAWLPLQSMIVQGLRNTGKAPTTNLAEELAIRWLTVNYDEFSAFGKMFEMYDAGNPGTSVAGLNTSFREALAGRTTWFFNFLTLIQTRARLVVPILTTSLSKNNFETPHCCVS